MKALKVLMLFALVASTLSIKSQDRVNISNDLTLTKLTENTFIHTSNNNNGIIFKVKNKAIIASTPDSDELTSQLLSYVQDSLKLEIVAYIIDIWHPDAMAGLDVVKQAGIKTYATNRTIKIAKEKGLPLPETGFKNNIEIPIENKKENKTTGRYLLSSIVY